MKNDIKYRIILRFKDKYPITKMCNFFNVSKSGYYDWLKRSNNPDRDEPLRELIEICQHKNNNNYGYRRIQIWLLREFGLVVNHKAVLRVMNKFNLLSQIRRKRRYVQYSNVIHRYENILNRDFNATNPNQKWVTDITYIHTNQGIMYLSVIKDLYDGFIVSHKYATSMSVNLVISTIKSAKENEKVTNGLALHSDQGFQYTSHAYFNLIKEYGIIPSMSRRGNCLDNACIENFFSHLKTECIYRAKLSTFEQARTVIDEYINYYNYERIQLRTKLTPYEKRCQSA